MSGPKLGDPWTEHPALIKSEAAREIARLRAINEALVEAAQRVLHLAKSCDVSDEEWDAAMDATEAAVAKAKAKGKA